MSTDFTDYTDYTDSPPRHRPFLPQRAQRGSQRSTPHRPGLSVREIRVILGERTTAWVPPGEVVLAAVDLLVLPSLTEAFPGVVIAAMAMGKPVIASRVGGIPEIIAHGQTGLLAEPNDLPDLARNLGTILGDAGLRARLAEAGRRRCLEHYDYPAQAQDFESILQELVVSSDRR